jgi:hypothetical protein
MKFKILIRMYIYIFFGKINCNTGIAPPTWGRGWGGALIEITINLN